MSHKLMRPHNVDMNMKAVGPEDFFETALSELGACVIAQAISDIDNLINTLVAHRVHTPGDLWCTLKKNIKTYREKRLHDMFYTGLDAYRFFTAGEYADIRRHWCECAGHNPGLLAEKINVKYKKLLPYLEVAR